MIKRLLVFISILIIHTSVYSSTVLVMPFSTQDADFFAVLSGAFALDINNKFEYDVIMVENYNDYYASDIGNGRVIDTAYIRNIAFVNNADYVVIGRVAKHGLKISVSADLINTRNLSIVGSSFRESDDIKTIINSVPVMVDEIFDYKGVATYLYELGEDAKGVNEIRKLLKVYINARNKSAETAVMIASFYGYGDILKKLIDDGADIELVRNDGMNALILAARQNNAEIVKILLDNRADINTKSANGFDVLLHAAYMGSYDAIKVLIEERYLTEYIDPADLVFSDSTVSKAMDLADARGYTRIVRYLYLAMKEKNSFAQN